MESILTSIKKLLGITEDYTHFDEDIIMHINSVFFTLKQLGVGPPEGFSISSKDEQWNDYLPDTNPLAKPIASYMYLKVRLLFDPPSSSALIDSMKRTIDEYEWRFNVEVDPGSSNGEEAS